MPESDWIYWMVIVTVQALGTLWLRRSIRSLVLSIFICIPFAAGCGAFYFLASALYSHNAAGGHINFGFAPMLFFMLWVRALPISATVGLVLLLVLRRWEQKHVKPARI